MTARRRRWFTFSLRTKLVAVFAVLSSITAAGCGHWPPVVNNKEDIAKLPATETSIRARGLSDDDIPSLSRLRGLRSIDFSGGWAVEDAKITDEGLSRLAKLALPRLEELSLGWCDKISDAGLGHIGHMQTIARLQLPACARVTDAGLPELKNARQLKNLNLSGCEGVTDQGIQQLAANQIWELIILDGCPNVTAKGVAKLQAALPNTKISKDDENWRLSTQRN